MSTKPKIFDLVANHGCLPMLPDPWAGLLCARIQGADFLVHVPLLERLRAKFSIQDLVASGVVVVNDQGEASLHSRLTDHDAIFLVARPAETEPPTDLAIEEGGLTGHWPMTTMFADYRTIDALRHNRQQLFLTFSLLDAAILTTLGLPVVLADGLATIGGKRLKEFFKLLGLDRPQPKKFELGRPRRNGKLPQRPLSLTFVGWSVANFDLTEPVRLQSVRDHFRRLIHLLGIELELSSVWKPSQEDLERFRFCLMHGDRKDIFFAVQDSIETSIQEFVPFTASDNTVPETYAESMKGWSAMELAPGDKELKKRTWDQMQRLHELEMVAPLLERAEIPDPVERNLVNVFAQLCRTLNPQIATFTAKYGQAMGERGSKASVGPLKEELQQLLALVDRVRALAQEIQPWRKKSEVPMMTLPKAKHSKPSSDGLG